MKDKHPENSRGNLHSESVRCVLDYENRADKNQEIEGENRHAADKTKLLGQDAENEVSALLRQEAVMALSSPEVAPPQKISRTDSRL